MSKWVKSAVAIAALTIAGSTAGGQPLERECGEEIACPLDVSDQPDRQYYVSYPEAPHDESASPVIVWYHGFRGSGVAGIRNRGLVENWTDAGYIFVAADGIDGRWTHQGNPRTEPDDDAYSVAILDDLARTHSIDRDRLVAAGFSSGGFMVWSLACFQGTPFTHFAPVSGAFWEPLPERCEAGPVTLRHTHGTADATVPLEGRWLRDTFKQGDVFESFDVMIANNACLSTPDQTDVSVPPSSCAIWNSCSGGGLLELCLHDGGHSVPSGWSASTQAWIDATASTDRVTTH